MQICGYGDILVAPNYVQGFTVMECTTDALLQLVLYDRYCTVLHGVFHTLLGTHGNLATQIEKVYLTAITHLVPTDAS